MLTNIEFYNLIKPYYVALIQDLQNNHKSGIKKNDELCGFNAIIGKSYQQELMVIGRAVNGWNNKINTNQAAANKIVEEKILTKLREDKEDFLSWVTGIYNGSIGLEIKYNPKRSQFWSNIKEICLHFNIGDDSDWGENIVWSNLYKIAPHAGRNPKSRLMKAQFAHCQKVLNVEIEALKPKRILCFTGEWWAEPFLHWQDQIDCSNLKYVERAGWILDNNERKTPTVIAQHPERKKRDIMVANVVETFETLSGLTR